MKLKKMVLAIFSLALGYKIISSIMCHLNTVAMINNYFPGAYKCISDIKKGRKDWVHQMQRQNWKSQKYIKVEKK